MVICSYSLEQYSSVQCAIYDGTITNFTSWCHSINCERRKNLKFYCRYQNGIIPSLSGITLALLFLNFDVFVHFLILLYYLYVQVILIFLLLG